VRAGPGEPDVAAGAEERVHVLRLFLALWPGETTLRSLAAWRDAIPWPPKAAPVADDRLHLTLHFIGSVPQARLPELLPGLRVPLAPFDLCLDRAELWPRGLAVLSSSQAPAALSALHAGLADALRRLGLPVEQRTFRPHVTLARRALQVTLPDTARSLHWRVDGYSLVQSAQGYTRVHDYRAAGPPRSVSRREA
jgi:2'-5' RNA ligase